jgi:transposase
LKVLRYPNFICAMCERKDMLTKIMGRPQYACPCGYQVAPLVGTIFEKSSTDLSIWFLTMFIMVQTRGGVSAKAIERSTGVTYKTAWRMIKQIQTLM